MKLRQLKMKLNKSSYPILIGPKALGSLARHVPLETSSIFILSDKGLTSARKKLIQALKQTKLPVFEIPLKAGEDLKKISSIYPIYGKLLALKADRNSLIIALGGGSVGDAVGFIAATYMRGINWVGVPTTLLAQVDSSVGGKTGINHEVGKNLIGAFHQPKVVVCDTDFLKTLGQRELVSGAGEIVKYALTYDKKFYHWLETHMALLLKRSPKVLTHAIEQSLKWKCHVVAQDEFDRSGVREFLNFGHTFGHALESATQYKKYQHGEAVIWGMRFALALSSVRGKLDPDKRKKFDQFLAKLPVPSLPKAIPKDKLLQLMKKDKKAQGDIIRFVLLESLGRAVSDKKVTQEHLNQAYYALLGKEI